MKILIVDDSRTMRLILKRALRRAGYGRHPTIEASDGREALEVFESEAPGLILSDWNMPVMDGLEFCKAIRDSGSRVPFGFVTSEHTPEMRDRAKEAGATFLINKPFTPDKLDQALCAARVTT
ncbi:MAG TPA: response regulator [Myxococcota bacterium]|nr:response regulator [Myxococcota bacterium]